MPQGELWLQTGLWIALSLSVPSFLLATHTLQFLTHFSIMLLMAFLITDYYDPLSEVVPEDISRRICRFHNFVRKLPWLQCSGSIGKISTCYFAAGFCSMMQRCIMSEVRRSPFLVCISRSWFWKKMPIINKGTEKIYFQLFRPAEYLISRIPLLNFMY